MNTRTLIAAALLSCGQWAGAADAAIVDLDGLVNGRDSPVDLVLAAGTYRVQPVGTASGGAWDAVNMWGETTCLDPGGCALTRPTSLKGWVHWYEVYSNDLASFTVSAGPMESVFNGATGRTGWSAGVEFLYPDPSLALAHAVSSTFTLASSGPVGFAIGDSFLPDNLGGLSLEVSPVPEPSEYLMLLAGLGVVGAMARRRAGEHRRNERGEAGNEH